MKQRNPNQQKPAPPIKSNPMLNGTNLFKRKYILYTFIETMKSASWIKDRCRTFVLLSEEGPVDLKRMFYLWKNMICCINSSSFQLSKRYPSLEHGGESLTGWSIVRKCDCCEGRCAGAGHFCNEKGNAGPAMVPLVPHNLGRCGAAELRFLSPLRTL